MKLQSVLTLVDKPKHPQTALARTRRLVKESGARVHLLSYCWSPLADSDGVFARDQDLAIKQAMIAERRSWLLSQMVDAPELERARTSVLWTKDIASSVEGIAEKSGADLLIKSVHQSGTILHTPLDWALLRTAKIPVLLTTTRRRKQSGIVLAAIDVKRQDRAHQRLNRRVLDAAHTMAALERGIVHVVAAAELPNALIDLDILDKRKAQLRARLLMESGLNELLKAYDIRKAHRHMPIGKVGQAVNTVAHQLNADMLVVGTHAHRFKQLVGIGNSAEKIVARASCDVLAVHP